MATWQGDWTKRTDEEIFGTVGEELGSQASYWRDIEIRRRHYLLETRTSEATIAAAQAQLGASKAISDTAMWTKRSAIAVFVTAIIAALALLVQMYSMLGGQN